MSKKRRTRKQKLNTYKRRQGGAIDGFKIPDGVLKTSPKKTPKRAGHDLSKGKFLQADLTKTILLTMLAVALELALWQLFFRN